MKSAKTELKEFAIDGFLSTVAIASTTALINGDGPPALLWGFGGVAALTVLSRRWPWRQSSKALQWSRAFQSLAPLAGGGYEMRWHDRRKEQEQDEFVFFGLGLPVPISEATLTRFVGIARRRQSNALSGTQFSMMQAGNNFRQLKINWVLSQNHYTKKIYPRLAEDEYRGCLMILGYTRLMIARGGGSSGRLFPDPGQWSTERYVRTARDRFVALSHSPTPSTNLFGKIRNLYN